MKTILKNELIIHNARVVFQSAYKEDNRLISNLSIIIDKKNYSAKIFIDERNKVVIDHHFKYPHEKRLFSQFVKFSIIPIKEKLISLCLPRNFNTLRN